jgi:hypothetical protein
MTFNEFQEELSVATVSQNMTSCVFVLDRIRSGYVQESKLIHADIYVSCNGYRDTDKASEVFIVNASFTNWSEFSIFIAALDKEWKGKEPEVLQGEVSIETNTDKELKPPIKG